ncbi:hypothetical protein [Mangrovibacterium marinum]|uniref:Uncharacterized protein n=1 Tax=Mangrovibacterium marinum TaxID=1639118 RepID=A0A2T5C491_9BACT|nr:hypothetical protein [Mangrovibacterium marinum]PTN09612.1 hypothetical protein C8N47_104158 [Mangrovibacterium marinum]
MDEDELYNRFKELSDLKEAIEANGKAFHGKLGQDLFDLVFGYWPEMVACRAEMEVPLRELTVAYSHEAMESLNAAQYYLRTGAAVPQTAPVPQPLSATDAEERALKLHREMPDVDMDEWREIVWEDFQWQMKANHFVHRIHKLMKRAMTDFYLDDLLELDGKHLLLLDEYLYIMGASQFAEELYKLMDDREPE